jgi:hypothetical protein
MVGITKTNNQMALLFIIFFFLIQKSKSELPGSFFIEIITL